MKQIDIETINLFIKRDSANTQDMKNLYRSQIIENNIALVKYIVLKKYKTKVCMHELNDCFQDGYIGLIMAVDNFDVTKNTKFSSYACKCIIGQINSGINYINTDFKYPANFIVDVNKVRKLQEYNFNAKIEKMPLKQLSKLTELSEKKVELILKYLEMNNGRAISLNEDIDSSDGQLLHHIPDTETDVYNTVERKIAKEKIIETINSLNIKDTHKEMIQYRLGFYDNNQYTLKFIAEKYNCSAENVNKVCQKVIKKLSVTNALNDYLYLINIYDSSSDEKEHELNNEKTR